MLCALIAMNIDVKWNDEAKTVVMYAFHRGWNWDDFYNATKEAAIMLDAATEKTHIIMDFRNASILPSGAVTQIQRAFRNQKHANAGVTVVVGANSFIQAIVDMGRKLSKESAKNWDMQFVTTIEAALELTKSQSPNNP